MLDIAIVGFGPVGQTLAVLLGQAGHRVAAFERFQEAYRMPRAVHIDHEVMRILQSAGVAERMRDELLPLGEYHWLGADGEQLMVLRPAAPALSGWAPDYLFHQPVLEAALEARARELDTVTIVRGAAIDGIEERKDHVELRLGEHAVQARWVIGADGANSFVREALGIERRDLGFQERWLVVDVEPRDMAALDLPAACQWCDPRRPSTHVQSGPRHRRWEFKLLPGEHPANFGEERAWELLAPWFGPDDGELVRHTVYEFRSMLAERMREGRVLLAGDAAHLTPPFLGQGLGAGLRDAANIVWKLDLVLRGLAGESLLDTVSAERQTQNEFLISFAIELGKVLCELDPAKAAERDAVIRAAGPPPEVAAVPIGEGLSAADGAARGLTVQGRLEIGGREGLLDDLTGGGFTLLARSTDLLDALTSEQRAFLASIGTHVVCLSEARDLDGRATSTSTACTPSWCAPTSTRSAEPRPPTRSLRWSTTCAPSFNPATARRPA
jgi:2-polyprenyl-6-methoxyphenol hydroxylase-like FAD-dependent oxidoreductase